MKEEIWCPDNWLFRMGSKPVREVASVDLSESYEMRAARVFHLESGQYALITEMGCSCYDSTMADIDLFPTEHDAMKSYDAWEKQQGRSGSD